MGSSHSTSGTVSHARSTRAQTHVSTRVPTHIQSTKTPAKNYKLIANNYDNLEDLQQDLKQAGLESCNLIVGIDFTKSNLEQGGLPAPPKAVSLAFGA